MAPQTYLIGIAGPSGAGKSFLAQHLAERLHAPVLALDHYYRDLSHLAPEERVRSNFDEPAALEHELLIEQINRLRDGKPIAVPTYDFSIHTRSDRTWTLAPAPFVIIEGLFALYWPRLREIVGTGVYVELTEDACLQRRLERDVQERGRSPESVLAQFRSTVAPMAERFVRPTSQDADVIVSGSAPIEEGLSLIRTHIRHRAEHNHMKAVLDHLSATEPAASR